MRSNGRLNSSKSFPARGGFPKNNAPTSWIRSRCFWKTPSRTPIPFRVREYPREPERETPEEDKEKRAAAQWLKNQYFQRAHAYVKSGEYDLALAEVQRVIVLDGQDRFASEFELKIMQMLELRRRQPLVNQAGPGSGEPSSSGAPLSGGPQPGDEPGAGPGSC